MDLIEEKKELIILASECKLSMQCSYRDAAFYLTNNLFSISESAVRSYLMIYMNEFPERYLRIQEKVSKKNERRKLTQAELEMQIYNNVKLFLKGNSIFEIEKNSPYRTYFDIYHDLTEGIYKLDKELYIKVKQILDKDREKYRELAYKNKKRR